MPRKPLLQAAILWHKSGVAAAPNAGSVQMTQAFVDELLQARTLLQQLTRHPNVTTLVPDAWLDEAVRFNLDTNALEQFRA